MKAVSETSTLGVRGSDTSRISTKKIGLTLLNFGPNKRMHYKVVMKICRRILCKIGINIRVSIKPP